MADGLSRPGSILASVALSGAGDRERQAVIYGQPMTVISRVPPPAAGTLNVSEVR
jgi:hypothetical protein